MCGRYSFFLVLVLCCSISAAKEAVEIPLSEVWGMNLPGMKPVAHLEPESHGKQGETLSDEERGQRRINSMTYQLIRALSPDLRNEIPILPGFAVLGKGREALENAHAVLVKDQPIQNSFPEDRVVSAIFFAQVIYRLHLTRVERIGNSITIEYCLAPEASRNIVSPKLAIIPLGKLQPGKFQVNIVGFTKTRGYPQSDCKPLRDKKIEQLVCQPFEFSVLDNSEAETTVNGNQ